MRSDSILRCLLIVASLAAGCRQGQPETQTVVTEPVPSVPSGTMTLSSDQLTSLDWDGRAPSRPKVLNQRAFGDSGVVFDIRFPGNERWHRSIDYVSSGSGGRMTLVGLDAGAYETLALKFTLVSIDGAVGATLPQELVVGAVIGPTKDGKLSGYEPLTLSFAGQQTTGVARTPVGAARVREIGIHAHMANPEVWNPEGTVVTLRVEPAANAEVVSWSPPSREERRRDRAARRPNFGPSRVGAW